MKRIMIPMLLAMLFVACDRGDNLAEGVLPCNKYPLIFSVQGDSVTTRVSGKDNWALGDEVKMKVDEVVKTYKISNAGSGALVPSIVGDAFYWQRTDETKTIAAWYPTTNGSNINITNQANSFATLDYLTATSKNVSFTEGQNGIKIQFAHQMAMVKVNLSKGGDIIDEEVTNAKVEIYGNSVVSWTDGTVAGSSPDWITPTSNGREALMPPGIHTAGTPFIKVTSGSNVFVYTPSDNIVLSEGKQNVFNISMKMDELVFISQNIIEWTVNSSHNLVDKEKFLEPRVYDYLYADDTFGADPKGAIGIVCEKGADKVRAFYIGEEKTFQSWYFFQTSNKYGYRPDTGYWGIIENAYNPENGNLSYFVKLVQNATGRINTELQNLLYLMAKKYLHDEIIDVYSGGKYNEVCAMRYDKNRNHIGYVYWNNPNECMNGMLFKVIDYKPVNF